MTNVGIKYYSYDMNETYNPPFELTEDIVNLTIEICSLLENLDNFESKVDLKLRRESRIKTIYSSLAIENNQLSETQVSDVINGKHVIAPIKDITEVKNAYDAYENLGFVNPYSVNDFLLIHGQLMKDLVDECGIFRTKPVGVYRGTDLIHLGTRPEYVPALINQLFKWAKDSRLHPLIKSAIVHYEIEYIHPFSDGNGRTGRYWHSLILSKWKMCFSWLSIESMIFARQSDYYRAINISNDHGSSTSFIVFMLGVIRDVVKENVEINVGIKNRVLQLIADNPTITANEMAKALDKSSRQIERIIASFKADGTLLREGSNKKGSWIIAK